MEVSLILVSLMAVATVYIASLATVRHTLKSPDFIFDKKSECKISKDIYFSDMKIRELTSKHVKKFPCLIPPVDDEPRRRRGVAKSLLVREP